MKKVKLFIFISVLISLFIFSLNVFSQEVGMGLQFSNPEDLEKANKYEGGFRGEIPKRLDFSKYMPPVMNQGSQNSCVGFSVGYYTLSYLIFSYDDNAYYTETGTLDYSKVFSPAFIYNIANGGQNYGIRFIDAFEILAQTGCARWKTFPYRESDYITYPHDSCFYDAMNYIVDYTRFLVFYYIDIQLFKEAMNEYQRPINIGAAIDKSLIKDGYSYYNGGKKGNFIWKKYKDNVTGGHALTIVGYDDNIGAFKIINSWGTNWGEDGYFWIDYDFVPYCIKEAYIIY